MKITVRITGILEAEMELPETTISAMGVTNWNMWHTNQFTQAHDFIAECAKQAKVIIEASKNTDEPPTT